MRRPPPPCNNASHSDPPSSLRIPRTKQASLLSTLRLDNEPGLATDAVHAGCLRGRPGRGEGQGA